MSHYNILNAGTLGTGVTYQQPSQNLPQHVSQDSPAVDVMTDLNQVAAHTVTANLSVDDAEKKMIASGVRMLFVTNPLNHVIGIVTARDLSGERILRIVNDSHTPRKDLSVRDIMTPQHRIDVLQMGEVATARVGDILATMKRVGRQHAVVVDRNAEGHQTIRGLLSTTQIARQLGESVDPLSAEADRSAVASAG